jgi:uncharacterized protein (TIGR03083 family)
MTSQQQQETDQTQLPVAPSLIRQAALQELDRLNTFVQGLPFDDWSKPSAAGGWSIGDVIAHLNLTVGLYNGILRAGAKGWGSSSAWKTFGEMTEKLMPKASPAINALNSALPRLVRGALSPEVIKGQFAAGTRKAHDRIEGIGSTDYTRPVHYMGRAWPLSFFLAGVVNELAIHGWDMMSRLDADAHLSEDARAVLPWFYWGATGWMFRPSRPLTGSIQALLRDPDFEMWWTIDGSTARQGTGQVHRDVTISGESGTFVLILAGRIAPEDALRTTSITTEGDEDLGKAFLSAWKIV